MYSCIHCLVGRRRRTHRRTQKKERGEPGCSSGAGPSVDLSQACASEHQTILFAAIECDHHLYLQATPSSPFFSWTNSNLTTIASNLLKQVISEVEENITTMQV